MATQGVSRYIDAQYLPDPSDLPEGETFVICKPATMKMSVFRPWVACLCKRQQARNSVDPDMKIFRFKAYDKETGALLISHSDRESEPETPNQVPKKKASKARGGKRGQQKASAGRKGKGLQVKGKGKPGQKKHSTAAPDAETVGNDETGLPTTPPDSKSPAFAGIGWDAKMEFLKTLSENFAFQELCSWLSKQQVSESMICSHHYSLAVHSSPSPRLFVLELGLSCLCIGLIGHGHRNSCQQQCIRQRLGGK